MYVSFFFNHYLKWIILRSKQISYNDTGKGGYKEDFFSFVFGNKHLSGSSPR